METSYYPNLADASGVFGDAFISNLVSLLLCVHVVNTVIVLLQIQLKGTMFVFRQKNVSILLFSTN